MRVDVDIIKVITEQPLDMSDESQTNDEPENTNPVWSRTTAPQSQYTSTEVTIGLIVLIIGVLVVFGVPLFLA